MAEIKIEKKRPVWPWIIVILIILALVIYFVYANRENEDYNDDFNDDVTTEQIDDSINGDMDNAYDPQQNYRSSFDEFSAFEESISDSTRIAVDSSYTKKAFSNLARVVVGKADESSLQDSEALNDLRAYTTLSTPISSTLKGAGVSKNFKIVRDNVVKVLEAIQAKTYPELQSQITDLKQVAAKIDGSISMDKQQAHMHSFFRKSSDVLKAMNN